MMSYLVPGLVGSETIGVSLVAKCRYFAAGWYLAGIESAEKALALVDQE
mgnify:CR=1 FL=1